MVDVSTVTNVGSAIILVALASWLLILRFNSRAARVFALLLIARGLVTLFTQIGNEVEQTDPAFGAVWHNVATYLILALPFIITYFAWVYPRPRRLVRPVAVGLTVGLLVVEAWFLLDHCFVRCGSDVGIGMLAYPLTSLAYAGAALLFARTGRQATDPHYPALRLAATALAATAIIDAGIVVYFRAPSASGLVDVLMVVVAAVAVLAAVAVIAWIASKGRWLAGFSLGWALTSALGVVALGQHWGPDGWAFAAIGVIRIGLAMTIAYALVRHCLFDVTLRLRWTLDRSMIAGAFVLVFFVASETAEELMSQRFGIGVGLGAAALLVFLQAPLHRVTYRIARVFVPGEDDLGPDERETLYRDQAHLAWEDGLLGPRERRILDHLRDQLGIPEDRAKRLEDEARGRVA